MAAGERIGGKGREEQKQATGLMPDWLIQIKPVNIYLPLNAILRAQALQDYADRGLIVVSHPGTPRATIVDQVAVKGELFIPSGSGENLAQPESHGQK